MTKQIGRPAENYEYYIGKRFGSLVVSSFSRKCEHSIARFNVTCDCGNEKEIRLADLKSGRTLSCGCRRNKNNSDRLTTHGGTGTKLYDVWCSMKARCLNKNDPNYQKYGGRGVTVCGQWADGFEVFRDWAMTNGYQEGLSIDRIDNDGGYFPINCRWTDSFTQANNKGRSIKIKFHGKEQSLSEWSRELGFSYKLLHDRIVRLGWDHETALTTPARKIKKQS